MIKTVTLMAALAVGLGPLVSEADATIIRTAGPGDPYLFAPSYSYENIVYDAADPGGFNGISKTDTASKPYPISNGFNGQVCGNDNGSCTILTSHASSSTVDDHLGTVKASVQTTYGGAAATATLIYYFTVVGPDAAFVPVTISGSGTADPSPGEGGAANAKASIQVNYYNGSPRYPVQWDHTINPYEHNTFSQTIDIAPNASSYQGAPRIVLQAVASAGNFGFGSWDPRDPQYFSGGASSEIDPILSIADPELAKLYTIVVGLSSVPNVSPVPLPATAPLFAAAILALGLVGRRRIKHG